MNIDERLESLARRHEALTMNLELQALETQELRKLIEIDAENIRSLARIAQAHENRLDRMEGR